MEENKYPVSSGYLVIKEGAYGSENYFIKDMKSKKSGYTNEDSKNLLILCDGKKSVGSIANHLSRLYNDPKKQIKKTVIESLDYFRKIGYIQFSKKPYHRNIIFHKKEMAYSLDEIQFKRLEQEFWRLQPSDELRPIAGAISRF